MMGRHVCTYLHYLNNAGNKIKVIIKKMADESNPRSPPGHVSLGQVETDEEIHSCSKIK